MAIRMLDPLVADVPEVGAVAVEALDDDAADDDALGDDELELHPPISTAITATATPPAAMRARQSLDIALSDPFQRKAHEPYALNCVRLG
jgi:hypothetical protein